MLLKKQLIILVLLFYGRVLFGFQIPIDSIQKPHRLILTQGVISATKGHLPFWMVSNNSGRFSDNQSSSAYTSILFTKSAEAKKNVDYFYRIEAQSVIGRNTNKNSFIQAYGGISLRWVNIHLGLKEEVFGLNDSTLSVGNLVYGSNARPIPKIVLSTNGWVNAPILPQLFSFKAYLAHGWFEKNRYQSSAFLHQKNVYVRSKFIKNRLNIDFGINHNVQWGGA